VPLNKIIKGKKTVWSEADIYVVVVVVVVVVRLVIAFSSTAKATLASFDLTCPRHAHPSGGKQHAVRLKHFVLCLVRSSPLLFSAGVKDQLPSTVNTPHDKAVRILKY